MGGYLRGNKTSTGCRNEARLQKIYKMESKIQKWSEIANTVLRHFEDTAENAKSQYLPLTILSAEEKKPLYNNAGHDWDEYQNYGVQHFRNSWRAVNNVRNLE